MTFGFDCPAVSERKMFENNGHVHVFSSRVGADNVIGSNVLQTHKSVNLVMCCKFLPLNYFVTVFSI